MVAATPAVSKAFDPRAAPCNHGAVLDNLDTFLFDLDGTLTVPVLRFDDMRRELGLPAGAPIVHMLAALPPDERARLEARLVELEIAGAREARPAPGAHALIERLRSRGHALAIITRNALEPTGITLKAIGLSFDVVITRDCVQPVKPHPAPVREALRRLGRDAGRAIMIGDYVDDIDSGRGAGTRTCHVTNGTREPVPHADLVVTSLLELVERL